MSDRTVGYVPLQDQIADELRARITGGEFQPGDKLPSVRELREQWHCSDGPVREAFAILKGEGRITSTKGAAARVRVPATKLVRISVDAASAQAKKNQALRPEDERRDVGEAELAIGMPIAETHFKVEYLRIDASEELAGEFKLPSLEPLLQRNYETWTKEKAHLVLHSESFIPIRYIEGNPALLDQTNEPWPGGHWHQLKTVGIEIDRLSHSISAAQPTTRQRQDWNMEPGVPLLLVRTRSIDTQNRVVEVSTSIYPADRTTIGYVTQLSRWPDTSTNTGEMSL